MEPSREGLEELISHRLINQAEAGDSRVTEKPGDVVMPANRKADAEDSATKDSSDDDGALGHPAGLPTTKFTKVEKSLASLGFFTPSSRRLKDQKIKSMKFTRETDGKRVEVTADIVPSAIFGLPITADQDKYLALQKIITDVFQAQGKIENPIRFKSADLLRLLNRDTNAGKNYKEVSAWLDVMSTTTIISEGAVYIAGKRQFVRDRFRVFERAVSSGREMDDGSIADANYVWLSKWQIDNINNKFVLPIDLDTYQQLRNHIAKALVPLLQIWLFASHRAGSFEKRYHELCEILNVQKYKSPSEILRQFKPSLDELTAHEYLEKWRIEKTSDRKAFKIIFFHGPKFHRDRHRRIDQKNQSENSIVIGESEVPEPALLEPGSIEPVNEPNEPRPKRQRAKAAGTSQAVLPTSTEHESDLGPGLVDQLAARGLMPSVAIKLLVSVQSRIEKVADYIEYWDFVRAGKEVGPGLLYDLIKNGDALPSSFETSRQRSVRKEAEEKKNRLVMAKQNLEFAYEEYRRNTINRFIADTISSDELARRIEASIQAAKNQPTFWDKSLHPETTRQMAEHQVRLEISKQVSLLSFEDFCRTEAPRILRDYGIDPAELGITGSAQTSQR